jgi:hypothetical protein
MREQVAHYRRKVFTHWRVCGVATACGLAACDVGSATPTTVETVAGTELAPSQVSASTVADPGAPPPCDVGVLAFSAPDAAAIRIRNDAAVQCEVDVFESELADPLMEPNVWLDPGAEAEVLVEETDATCDSPRAISSIRLVVNGSAVDVPIAIPPTCGMVLSAIYQVEPAG